MQSRRLTHSNISTGAPISGKDIRRGRQDKLVKDGYLQNNSFKEFEQMKQGKTDSIKDIHNCFDIAPILQDRQATTAVESANVLMNRKYSEENLNQMTKVSEVIKTYK